jgi:hypothetical protein
VIDELPRLLRRWAVDWLAGADATVCEEILAPSYRILIGGYLLDGRETYVRETVRQLNRFPGLGLTVHELVHSGEEAAVRFTEHGAAASLDWRPAAWQGIALFRSDGEHLVQCFAEEDYLSRRRQLDSGLCDAIEPPGVSPWTTRAGNPDPAAEATVTAWLERGELSGVTLDDSWQGHDVQVDLSDTHAELDALFSSEQRVAFHGVMRGSYARGLGAAGTGQRVPAALHLGGIVTVADGRVTGGHVVRDRLGLQRALRAGQLGE